LVATWLGDLVVAQAGSRESTILAPTASGSSDA
jgi:hypothetical protein